MMTNFSLCSVIMEAAVLVVDLAMEADLAEAAMVVVVVATSRARILARSFANLVGIWAA